MLSPRECPDVRAVDWERTNQDSFINGVTYTWYNISIIASIIQTGGCGGRALEGDLMIVNIGYITNIAITICNNSTYVTAGYTSQLMSALFNSERTPDPRPIVDCHPNIAKYVDLCQILTGYGDWDWRIWCFTVIYFHLSLAPVAVTMLIEFGNLQSKIHDHHHHLLGLYRLRIVML